MYDFIIPISMLALIMKKNLTVLLILIQTLSCFGQFAGRKFVFQNESLAFINDSLLDFTFISNGCMERTLRGVGKYQIINNQLVIQTVCQDTIKPYKIEQQAISPETDSTTIYFIFSYNQIPISNAQYYLLDSTFKSLGHRFTDKTGVAQIENDPRIHFLNIYNGVNVNVSFKELYGKISFISMPAIRVLGNEKLLFDFEDSVNIICLTGPLPLPENHKENAKRKRRIYLSMMTNSWPWNWCFRPSHIHDPKRHCLNEINN